MTLSLVVGALCVLVVLQLVLHWVALGEIKDLRDHRQRVVAEANNALNILHARLVKLESERVKTGSVIPLRPQPPKGL